MHLTLNELVDKTVQRMSQVAGKGVQIYAEDRVALMLQHKFDILFVDEFWPLHMKWRQDTLDGTLGVVTSDLSSALVDFDDIAAIYPEAGSRPLTILPRKNFNPYRLSGNTPIHYTAIPVGNASPDEDKIFQIWPNTATGDIQWGFRLHPKAGTTGRMFEPTDKVPFDMHALILGAAFDYLEDDATNPNATQKFQAMFESRLAQLKHNLNSQPVSLRPGVATIHDTWRDLH